MPGSNGGGWNGGGWNGGGWDGALFGNGGGWDGGPAAHAVAGRARALAEQVRRHAGTLRAPDDDAWRGAAASAAAAAQACAAAALDGCAAQLEDVARAALAHARTAEQRADELEQLVRRARELLDGVAGRP